MAVDKLVDSTQLDSDLTSVANAIRAKSGGSSQLAFPAGFVSEIQAIPSGGSFGDALQYENIEWDEGKITYVPQSATIHGDTIVPLQLTQQSFGGTVAALSGVSSQRFTIADDIKKICAYAAYYSKLIPDVSFPECTYIGRGAFEAGGAATYQKVTNVYLPKVTELLRNTFKYQLSLTAVQIGSVGHPVTSIESAAFDKCTQSGLTMTVYVDDNTPIPLANAPWGATNATIVYRSATSGEVRT